MNLTEEGLMFRYGDGQLEVQNPNAGYVYRGEIERITITGDTVNFVMTWMAKGKNGVPLNWVHHDNLSYSAKYTLVAKGGDMGDDRLAFPGAVSGELYVLFPRGSSEFGIDRVEGGLPIHAYAASVLKQIVEAHTFKSGDELIPAQAEYRGALRMMLCKLPQNHENLRQAVRDTAVLIDMTDDDLTSQVLDHIEDERLRIEEEQAEIQAA